MAGATTPPQMERVGVFLQDINQNLSEIYFATSVVSVIFASFVIISFVAIPKMRRHPAQLLFNRTLLDLVICLCHIIAYAGIVHRGDPSADAERTRQKCRALSFFYQVALFGSNSWYFMLSVDLFLAVRNPFSCNKDYMPYYYFFVYTASLVTGIILVTGNYGLTVFNYCWVQDGLVQQSPDMSITQLRYADVSAENWIWGIYYGPHLILCVISIGVVVFTTVALHRGLPASGETRRQVVRFGFYYVVAFAVEWTLRLSLYLVQDKYLIPKALEHADNGSYRIQLHNVAIVYGLVEGLRGVVDVVLWFGTGTLTAREVRFRTRRAWAKWTGADFEESGALDAPLLDKAQALEVSSVLRHDMIMCTSWGIVDSAPVNIRPPNLSVTGFEDSVRQQLSSSDRDEDDGMRGPTPGPGDMNLQLNAFDTQRNDLQLWLRSIDNVRTRRIHCPTALQSTTFDFRDYAPEVFSCVRSLRNVDPITYCQSFNMSQSKGKSAMMEKFTEGRSGSFFYFTHDSRYIVKTVTDGETALLNQHVRDYFFHLHSNPDSLLTRFFGLHAMRLSPEQKFISLMVMENIFPTEDYLRPTERYDLKGSWVARRTLKGKNLNVPISKLTLKDNDLKRKIRIGPEAKARLLGQLRRDVGFLASIGIMDYSLLIGIRDFENDPREELPAMEMRSRTRAGGSTLTRRRDPLNSLGYVPPSLVTGGASASMSMGAHPSPASPSLAAANVPPPVTSDPGATVDDGPDAKVWHRSFYGGLLSIPPVAKSLADDYSVTESAIHEIGGSNKGSTGGSGGSGGRTSSPVQPEDQIWSIYYMGLIDILQRYNFAKKVEHFFKSNVRCMDSHGISAVNVNDYAARFIKSMDDIFI